MQFVHSDVYIEFAVCVRSAFWKEDFYTLFAHQSYGVCRDAAAVTLSSVIIGDCS